jgi:Zn-dependent peptidase ImmA (M78 family)
MRLPKVINILGQEIKIVYDNHCRDGDYKLWGYYDSDKSTIHLQRNMPKTRKMQVFLHECLHAIEGITSLTPNERRVEQMSNGILSLLRNNTLDFN